MDLSKSACGQRVARRVCNAAHCAMAKVKSPPLGGFGYSGYLPDTVPGTLKCRNRPCPWRLIFTVVVVLLPTSTVVVLRRSAAQARAAMQCTGCAHHEKGHGTILHVDEHLGDHSGFSFVHRGLQNAAQPRETQTAQR